MLEKLEAIFQRWKDVEAELSSPDAMADMKRFAQLNKEYKDLAKVVDEYNIYRNIMPLCPQVRSLVLRQIRGLARIGRRGCCRAGFHMISIKTSGNARHGVKSVF